MYKLRSHPILNRIKTLKPLALILTALLGSFLFVYLFGASTYDLDGLTLTLSTKPTLQGKTVIELPPFGNVSAITHNIPAEFSIKLDYIGTELANSFLNNTTESDNIINNLKTSMPNLIIPFLIRQVLLGSLGATLAIILIWRSSLKTVLASAFFGGLVILLVISITVQNYNIKAFKEPEYSGVLTIAPNIIPEPNKLLDKLDMIQHQTRKAADSIQTLFTNVNELSILGNPEEDKEIRKILLVGDLHSNPVGVEFIKELASNFKVDIIVDTGDLTDFGIPLETKMTEGLLEITIPYVFVAGNHDTPETVSFVKKMQNSTILEGNIITIDGVVFKGSPDPLSKQAEVVIENREEWESMICQQVKNLLPGEEEKSKNIIPDIVVVHNHEAAQKLSKQYPLVVHGHTHEIIIFDDGKHIRINPGSSGAGGIRGLYSKSSIPYSAVILYLKPGEKPVAADIIKYDLLSDRFFLERKLFKNQLTMDSEIKS